MTISEYLKEHQEQAFILKAFAVIFLIISIQEYLSGLFILILFPIIFLVYIRLKAMADDVSAFQLLKQHITFIPVMRAEGDRKKEKTPWVTYALIATNFIVFYGIQLNPYFDFKHIVHNFSFLPIEPNSWNGPVSAFTSMFLHGSHGHVWGNMLFLWALGTVVEKRVGSGKFILLYLITGLCASLAFVGVHYFLVGSTWHGIGASGAIAGVMGIFAVRCYFKSMIFPLPIFGVFFFILPISIKIRLNSLVIIGLFFLADLSGGVEQIAGNDAGIAHWAHIGGMVSGLILAGIMGLGKHAVEERHLDIGVNVSERGYGLGAGEKSLEIALQHNPNNAEALLHLARIKSKFSESDEGKDLYQRAIKVLATTSPTEATQVFSEYYSKYFKGVEPNLQYRLADIFRRNKDLDMASRCYEILVNAPDTPAPMKERALFQCASVLEEMGLADASSGYFQRYLDEYPASPAAEKIKKKLGVA